ncbi:class I SAM-dependent methyltransferase [Streptomyces mobaraensis NBRC 13819 = DSM 40847]|uniref:Class I SAM-dependent methyltransferase n=2 Tax=Streptomyces mobaraensis TaxID=35621 RepID=A0A5N5WBT9_STRMB|nr:type 11 methyltransferase [Streptomyces mobaraensis NBRC 13819 = DSM 40847]KAB7847741.1 class I SAM-dependent methyltransferase [Streptomyces mobaraensis]QTT74965.1 class I SAM-dependent methyltransferase [Streptomyces mobaraensis NBRC 13819 = DSM 40847]
MVSLLNRLPLVGALTGAPARPRREPTHDEIVAERYRERTDPRPGDWAYAHLLDLRDALAEELRGASGRWLDFGAGTSPYRGLLPGAELETAEMRGGEDLTADHELDADGLSALPDGSFDGILSTQVLEHVTDPDTHLREALRLLRPGGKLVLSTHGVWEEHGGQDLWRWTADGLAAQAERSGFTVDRAVKLTCGPRGLLLLLRYHGRQHGWPAGGPVGLLLRTLTLADRLRPRLVDDYLDRVFGGLGRVEGPAEPFYLDILLTATKPSAPETPERDAK